MSYCMLNIPVTARLTDEKGVQRHNPTARKSPAAPGGPIDAPVISEQERISHMRRQRWQNTWKAQMWTHDVRQPVQESKIDDSGPTP